MVRLVGIVLAVVFGASALLLVAGPVTTVEDGRTVRCGSVIGAAAVDPTPAACHEDLVGRTELVAIAALACAVTASLVLLERAQPEYGTSTCQSASI